MVVKAQFKDLIYKMHTFLISIKDKKNSNNDHDSHR